MTLRARAYGIVAALAMGLAGCSSGDSDVRTQVLLELPQQILQGRSQPPAPLPAELVARALDATEAPVLFVAYRDAQGESISRQIARNGPHRTFATGNRQLVTLRGGMITSTRGVGADLMASEAAELIAAISRQRPGTASYSIEYLTAENLTVRQDFTCNLTVGGAPLRVAPVPIEGVATMMTADCNSPDLRITNRYAVAPDGYILAGEQWLSPRMGRVAMQTIRR